MLIAIGSLSCSEANYHAGRFRVTSPYKDQLPLDHLIEGLPRQACGSDSLIEVATGLNLALRDRGRSPIC